MTSSIKIVRCLAPGKLVFGDQPALDSPPEGWALVDVSHVGICGTDFHIFEGKHPYLAYPRVMGHEVSGTVAAINGPAERLGRTGRHHQPLSLLREMCCACQQAKPNCCVSIEVLGVHRDGAMSEQVLVPGAKPASSRRPVAGRGSNGRVSGRRFSRRSQIYDLRGRSRIGDRRRADWSWHRAVCANRETASDRHGCQCRTAGLCCAAIRVPGD